MAKDFTEQVFRTTYKDDFKDSDNYHRILFNSGRALQARELTQLQTIIQKEISRLGSNLFVEGAAIQTAGLKVTNNYEFIKLAPPSVLPSNLALMENSIFEGLDSGIKVRVNQAVSAVDADPETLYVTYLDAPAQIGVGETVSRRVIPGETLTGIVNGNVVDVVVQTTNSSINPALGKGSLCEISEGSFFVQGHFVFCPAQSIILSKYTNNAFANVGFKVIQDIVTSDDNIALYDNQGVTPNLASPGADRYRIRLQLIDQINIASDETFVHLSNIQAGKIVSQVTTTSGFNSIRKELALRTFEESGNYIKKQFKSHFIPNDISSLKLKITPGIAYINGYRIEKIDSSQIIVPKPQETMLQNNDGLSVNYGNYFEFTANAASSGGNLFNIGTCQKVYLKDVTNATYGEARVRAIHEGSNGKYNLHVFDIKKTTTNGSLTIRDIHTISSVEGANTDSNPWITTSKDASGYTVIKEPNSNALLFPLPISRPKSLSDVSLTVSRLFAPLITDGSGEVTISLSGDEDFTNINDWIVSDPTNAINITRNIALSGSQSATISNLPASTSVSILAYVSKGVGSIRQKTLTEVTTTATLVTDPISNQRYIPLSKSDIYNLVRVTATDSDGDNLLNSFTLDNGQRDGYYGDGRLIYSGSGLDSAAAPVFVRFKYFTHGAGDFFAVNSYTGQLEYSEIPSHRLQNGTVISLRDAMDFRPSTNGSGVFTESRVSELPQPTSLVRADTEYYMPRFDKLCLSENGEMRYIVGSSSLTPKYPTTPLGCIDLYKYELNANTLHTQDLKSKVLPLKGYTMADIGRLDKKIEKLEEVTTMSLLELYTAQTRIVDSDGNDRIKAGFFVDNFKDHRYTDTKSIEHRASLDPQHLYARPSFTERAVDVWFDQAESTNTVKKGDKVLLDFTEVAHTSQTVASKSVNVNPFMVEYFDGNLRLSPSGDNWKNSDIDAPAVVDGGTRLDTTQALLWNNWEWNWNGVDINDLQVGASQSQTSITTSTTQNAQTEIVSGNSVTQNTGYYTYYGDIGVSINLEGIGSLGYVNIGSGIDPAILAASNDGTYVPKTINKFVGLPSLKTGYKTVYQEAGPGDTIDVTIPETLNWTIIKSTNCTAVLDDVDTLLIVVDTNVTGYECTILSGGTTNPITLVISGGVDVQSNPITSGTVDVFDAETTTTTTTGGVSAGTTTNTTTTVTVNRVAGESTIREIIGTRVVDVALIPWVRSRTVSFIATGLRANSRYWPFFDTVNVSAFCKAKPFVLMSDREIDYDYSNVPALEHSEGSGPLITDASGRLEGEFEIPCNDQNKFRSGQLVFELLDISLYNKNNNKSSARAIYNVVGEVSQDVVSNVRVLQIVGSQSTTVASSTVGTNVNVNADLSTDNVATVEASDEYTRTEVVSGSTEVVASADQPQTTVDVPYYTDWTQETAIVDPDPAPPYNSAEQYYTDPLAFPAPQIPVDTPVATVPAASGVQRYTQSATLKTVENAFRYIDPTAQSFAVEDPNGIFVTRLTLYFASKDDGNEHVSVEIRPMVNGAPDSIRMIDSAFVSLHPNQVNVVPSDTIASMRANGTSFIFPEPIYLEGGAEYAFVIRSTSMKYRVFISEVEDFILGSTELRITKQPTLGSLYKSQNSQLWEPDQRQDVAFILHRANFKSQGTAIIENRQVPPTDLLYDPLYTTAGSAEIVVRHKGHGLRVGDSCQLFGLTAGTEYNGILGSDISGQRVVTKVDAFGYTFNAAAVANKTGKTGGTLRGLQNIVFETIRPMFNMEHPSSTNYSMSGKFVQTTSFASPPSAVVNRFTRDNSYRLLKNKTNNAPFTEPMMIINKFEEATQLPPGERSATIKVNMVTADSRVSPAIDMQAAQLACISNWVDNQLIGNLGSFNEAINYVPETHPSLGSSAAKHITIPINLLQEAVGLKVLLAANKPPEAEFHVYWRATNNSDVIRSTPWEYINPENTLPSDIDKNVFREYRYLIGGPNGEMEPFTTFQLKIVFTSTNSTQVAVLRDLRCIAMAV